MKISTRGLRDIVGTLQAAGENILAAELLTLLDEMRCLAEMHSDKATAKNIVITEWIYDNIKKIGHIRKILVDSKEMIIAKALRAEERKLLQGMREHEISIEETRTEVAQELKQMRDKKDEEARRLFKAIFGEEAEEENV